MNDGREDGDRAMVMSQRMRKALAVFMAACPEARHAEQEFRAVVGEAFHDGMDSARKAVEEVSCRVALVMLGRVIAELREAGLVTGTDEQVRAIVERVSQGAEVGDE